MCLLFFIAITVIHKVRKTQHQNPEFDHTQGEVKEKPAKKYTSIQRGIKLRKPSILVVKLSFILSFLFPERLHYRRYIYFHCAPKCTTTRISLESCALNAEYEHFIPSCSISNWVY